MDTLSIIGLAIPSNIGVYAWEQRIQQTLLLDIHIQQDLANCQDELANTTDYDSLCRQVTTLVSTKSFHLIETVAEEVAAFTLSATHCKEVTVSVSKPHAIKNAKDVKVTITRSY